MNASRRAAIIRSIVVKDLREFSRDRLWVILTPVMLVFYVGLFWILPSTVDETVTLGVYQRGLDVAVGRALGSEQGLRLVAFESAEALEAAVAEGGEVEVGDERMSVSVGIAFPDDLREALTRGAPATVRLFVDAAVPAEVRTAMSAIVREITYAMVGIDLPVAQPTQELVVLGADRAGDQVSLQDRMRPLLVVLVLLVESMALAGLVAVEIQSRTAKAVVATPATIGDLLTAKGVTGTLLAFSQAALLMLLIGALGFEPLLLLLAVLIGAVMMAGVGMIAGSAGRDFMSTLFISMLFIVPLAVPAIAALFPGSASIWVEVLPTYGFIQTLVGVTAHGLSWSDSAGYLVVSAAWCAALFAAGWYILRRRVEAL